MYIQHAPAIRRDFPGLAAGVLAAEGVTPGADVEHRIDAYTAIAKARLAEAGSEAELAEIQAWRRAFARLGLKPTRYRCAAESLLRRFRREGALPRLHPVVDLCNAVSLAFAVPVAAIDTARVDGGLVVRPAAGDEVYEAFSGEVEHPEPGEVTFADEAGRAHARRWTHRQSGWSAVRPATTGVLVVAEALHPTAPEDVARLTATLAADLRALGCRVTGPAVLTAAEPRFAC
jgi:DNA/RNA-binding domain of Phe-tRNA-synthetase-like protein